MDRGISELEAFELAKVEQKEKQEAAIREFRIYEQQRNSMTPKEWAAYRLSLVKQSRKSRGEQ